MPNLYLKRRTAPEEFVQPGVPNQESGPDKSTARMIFDLRQARAQFFALEMLGEPAWDMLLVLYTAEEALPLAEIVRRTNTPHSTASRWLHYLDAENLVTLEPDARDGRMQKICLTLDARGKLSALFSGFARRLSCER